MNFGNRINFDYFDIETYLQARHIHYDLDGKNVQAGWIGLNCLWCSDPSNHLGINLDSLGINCFRCPVSGTIIKLVMKIEGCSYEHAEKIIEEFSRGKRDLSKKTPQMKQIEGPEIEIIAPSEAIMGLLDRHAKYLRSRNFDPHQIYKEYGVGSFDKAGFYKHRLYIPIMYRGRIISYTTRDITNKAKIPYLHAPKYKSVMHPKMFIYNLDNAGESAIVVEGVTDVWRGGRGFIATFGLIYTHSQIMWLKNFKRLFILPDGEEEAYEYWEKFAHDLSAFVPEVIILKLGKGDPCDLSKDEIKSLRKMCFGKIY